jgi:hypothetical protein
VKLRLAPKFNDNLSFILALFFGFRCAFIDVTSVLFTIIVLESYALDVLILRFQHFIPQNKIFLRNDFVNNSVWSSNMGLRVKGGPGDEGQTVLGFPFLSEHLHQNFWWFVKRQGEKRMLSTERTFGGAFFEVPTGMMKKRQIAPSLLQMSASAFTKAALQLTDFCKMTTCCYNIRRRYMRWLLYTNFWVTNLLFWGRPISCSRLPQPMQSSSFGGTYLVRSRIDSQVSSSYVPAGVKSWHYEAFSPPPHGEGSYGVAFTSPPSEFFLQCIQSNCEHGGVRLSPTKRFVKC